jgi:hypothetical protein
MHMRRTAVAITAVLVLALCSTARADDASLWRAYNGHGAEMNRTFSAWVKAVKRFTKKPSASRAKASIAAERKMIDLLRKLITDVRAENASTDNGATAKQFAVKGLREWRDMHVYDTRMLRAFIRHDRPGVRRWGRRSTRVGRRSEKDINAAEAAFKKAGYSYPQSQKPLPAHG